MPLVTGIRALLERESQSHGIEGITLAISVKIFFSNRPEKLRVAAASTMRPTLNGPAFFSLMIIFRGRGTNSAPVLVQ